MEKMEPNTNTAKKGLVMVITGNGKGKTTSAFGQALRAIGQGYKVCIIQFMKGREYGEVIAASKYLPDLRLYQYGLKSFVKRGDPQQADIEQARQGLKKAEEIMRSGEYDMVVLDEINVAVDFSFYIESFS